MRSDQLGTCQRADIPDTTRRTPCPGTGTLYYQPLHIGDVRTYLLCRSCGAELRDQWERTQAATPGDAVILADDIVEDAPAPSAPSGLRPTRDMEAMLAHVELPRPRPAASEVTDDPGVERAAVEPEITREVDVPVPAPETAPEPASEQAPAVSPEPVIAPESRAAWQAAQYRDAMHMATVITGLLTRELVEHPVVQAHPEWGELVERCTSSLGELRRAIGGAHESDDEAESDDHKS